MKARDADPARSLKTCESLGAEDKGILLQKDTYFGVPRGRLKLREERGATPHLISYERPDLLGDKESHYRIVEVEDAVGLKEVLASALDIDVVVSKERRLFLLDEVRIHLDRIDGLGSFIEFEGVAAPEDVDLAHFEALLADLRNSFEIEDADLLGGSYCDLALAAAARRTTQT